MSPRRRALLPRAIGWMAAGVGLAVLGYATYVGRAWVRYGTTAQADPEDVDSLLDSFMPEYEVVERHQIRVLAPPEVALAAAAETSLQHSAIVRAIFRARELMLGAEPGAATRPTGLLAEVQSLGWRVLAERPGREIVVGAVTQPWMADVVFRGLPPDEFTSFDEPEYVKIVWNLRADPSGPAESIIRTETRVATTDSVARSKFRWYWARFSPGIVLIRRLLLGTMKQEAERRARPDSSTGPSPSSDHHAG